MNPLKLSRLAIIATVATAFAVGCGKKQITLSRSVPSSNDVEDKGKYNPPITSGPQILQDCTTTESSNQPLPHTIRCILPNLATPVASVPTLSAPTMATIKVTSGNTNIPSSDIQFDPATSSLLIPTSKMKSNETLVIIFSTAGSPSKSFEDNTCVTARQKLSEQVRDIDALDKSCTLDSDCVMFKNSPVDSCPEIFYTRTTTLELRKADLARVIADVVRECPTPAVYCTMVFRRPSCVFENTGTSVKGKCNASL